MFVSNDQIKNTHCAEIIMACNHANAPVRTCLPSMIVNSNEAIVTLCLSIKHIPNSGVDVHEHKEITFTKTLSTDEALYNEDYETPEQFNWYCRRSDVPSNGE